MSIEETYLLRKDNPIWNTSYPLSPEDWSSYRIERNLPFDNEREMSFYVHIPFCRQLCSFCEYTRMVCPDEKAQAAYIDTLYSDIRKFKESYPNILLRGFDIGGGTPTALTEDNFVKLMDLYRFAISGLDLSNDYEPSIEGTFDTLSERKIASMVDAGIHRLSLGIQSTDNLVLCLHHRKVNEASTMNKWIVEALNIGIHKVNIDLMYGLKGQTKQTIDVDLNLISELCPQQVTLYELRTNMIANKDIPTKAVLYEQYSLYYDGLMKLGYKARFGENAFSLDDNDRGLSSYLRSRMLEGVSYKGFGISAQSMSKHGISYNVGKGNKDIRTLLPFATYEGGDTYLLPSKELASKYIAIGAYNGSISMKHLSDIIGKDASVVYKNEIEHCLNNELLVKETDNLVITRKGFEHYGAVFSLFYSKMEV